MIDDLLNRASTISDPTAGAVFTKSNLRRIVMLFAAEPRTLSDVARTSGLNLKRLHYHVQKLCRLGLVEVVEERKRGGRPLKLYRAVNQVFFIPAEVAPKGFQEELHDELRECLQQAHSRSRGLLLSLGAGGEPRFRRVAKSGHPMGATEAWRILKLSPEEAKSLEHEINSLFERFQNASSGEGDVYLVHGAVARRIAESTSVDNARS